MNKKQFVDYLNTIVNKQVSVGMTLGLVKKDSRELFKVGQMDENFDVTFDSIYDLASVSKVIGTTTAILKLIEDGHLHLETKVKEILTHYKFDSTILDLLTHQSGLPADDKLYKGCKNKEEFSKFIYNLDLAYTPNTKVVYSDFGFNLLGFIIEHFKGNINTYLDEILFKPLNLKNTSYYPNQLNINLIAPSEKNVDRGIIRGSVMDGKAFILDGLSGNAGLFSNVNDLSNFIEMILNNGTFNNQQILKEETISLLKQTFTPNLDVNRTLGFAKKDPSFSQGTLAGNNLIYHTGFSGPMILIDFDNNFGIIHLTNRCYPNRSNIKIIKERNLLIDNIYKYIDL